MPQSLVQFHFNPIKFGQVIRTYAKDRGVSQVSMAAKTGISYDTVGNIYTGKVQKIPFEYVFKICVVLGIAMEVLETLMLKDEDIDFEDQVLLYDTQQDTNVQMSDVFPTLVPGPVPESVANAAIAAAGASPLPPSEVPSGYYTIEDLNRAVAQANAKHEIIIAHMEESRAHLIKQHEQHISDLKAQHENERVTAERYQKLLHRLIDGVMGKQEEV